MKKTLAIILAGIMALALCACGGSAPAPAGDGMAAPAPPVDNAFEQGGGDDLPF